jgi:transcriptional regulator with XRE-family HTH domain
MLALVGSLKKHSTETRAFARKLGFAIRRARVERDLSQDELAWRCDIHRAYMGVIERGEQNITLLKLAQVCRGLGIKPSELLARIGQ